MTESGRKIGSKQPGIEEQFGCRIEARPGGISEIWLNTFSSDLKHRRSRLLRIWDRIWQIKDRRMPGRSKEAGCDRCKAREDCETRCLLVEIILKIEANKRDQ